MNDRVALLIALVVACVFTMNTQRFISTFPSASNFIHTSVAQAETLPFIDEKAEQPLRLPSSPNALEGLSAHSFYVSHEIPDARLLLQYNPYEEKSLASLTKLMTALTLLNYDIDWNETVKILPSDIRGGSKPIIKPGDNVSVKDLWLSMLIASDNDSTASLVRHISQNENNFVEKMNILATEMGLTQTKFVEPTGLAVGNISTSREFAMVARSAFKQELITDALSRAGAVIIVSGREKKILNSDQMIRYQNNSGKWNYFAGKTGFTYAAGYTVALMGHDANGRNTLIVVLNSQNDKSRAKDTEVLINWAGSQ